MAKIRKFSALICFGVVLCSFSFTSNAQTGWYEEQQRTFHGGIVAGTNFTQVDGDRYAGFRKVGFNVGAILYAQFAPHVAASMEILYSQKGARAHFAQISTNKVYMVERYRIGLNYAEVPIQLHYYDKRKSHFGAGFSYSQLISSSETVTTTPAFPSNIDLDRQFPFRKFDVNFIAGGNLKLYKGLHLNARFAYSLLPIRKIANTHPELARADQFNNIWTFRLMYLFQ
ncbi:MAG: PorT family protein [Sphingobacteriales bacterium]|nr:MAG: PorT family protein [Sphingobacteriales bacterium]